MTDFEKSNEPKSIPDWRNIADQLLNSPKLPAGCPVCNEQSLQAVWQCINLKSRKVRVVLTCSSCTITQELQTILPKHVAFFHPPEQSSQFISMLEKEILPLADRVRQHANTMPAAAFTTHPLWSAARWSATTFRFHPTSEAPPVMGLVFDNAEAGKEIFREAERQMNHTDRFEEIRVSIIEDAVYGQEQRPGYSVHICPDPDALAAHATADDFVLNPNIVPFLGRWNRHYPILGKPLMLPEFKQEFEKHKEFLLAPVVRKTDGQLYFAPELGIIKNEIHFRLLSDIKPNDPDAVAVLLPQLIVPPM